jgi:hypothetical protein
VFTTFKHFSKKKQWFLRNTTNETYININFAILDAILGAILDFVVSREGTYILKCTNYKLSEKVSVNSVQILPRYTDSQLHESQLK